MVIGLYMDFRRKLSWMFAVIKLPLSYLQSLCV